MSNLVTRTRACLVLTLAAATAGSHAQAALPQKTAHFLTWENDSKFFTDRFYTSGVQLSSKHALDKRGPFARDLTFTLCHWFNCDASNILSTQRNVGQLIFTPRDITQADPAPLDRPWAGFLYYEKIWSFRSSDQQTLTIITGQIGATGPLSLAEPAQTTIHRLLGRPRPMGWHNQIGASLGLNLSVEKRVAQPALSFDLPRGVRFNSASYWRLAAGTVQTYAAAGVAVVIGKNLPPVSPPPPGIGNAVLPTMTGPLRSASCLFAWLQCTAFASAEARLMAYNLFLDGRPWRDDPHVDKRAMVVDLVLGNRFDLPRTRSASRGPWFVQTKVTRRSPDFHSPLGVPAHLVYALTAGTEF